MLTANLHPATEVPTSSKSSASQPTRKSHLAVPVSSTLRPICLLHIRVRQWMNRLRHKVSSVRYRRHKTREYIRNDTVGLERVPKHLSTVLRADGRHIAEVSLKRLIDEAAELAAWCACVEIPMLSIYEKTGVLKEHMPRLYDAVMQKFNSYCPDQQPKLWVTSPHMDDYSLSAEEKAGSQLKLHLISATDGRESIIDLTRSLAELSRKGELSPHDISLELVDAKLSEDIMSEPELLIMFGPDIELSGYPPWQIRLTEIFCLEDNRDFGYPVFLKGLWRYSRAEMRRGK